MRIVESIVRNEDSVLALSSLMNGQYGVKDICLSLPSVVNANGIERVLELPLSPLEKDRFVQSAETLKKLATDAGL